MSVLVTGGSGLVGWRLLDAIADTDSVAFTYLDNEVEHPTADGYSLDVRDADQVDSLVTELDPDVVVHAAAMTDVDDCERNPTQARRVNVGGTKNIVSACESVGADIVFLSTSFVFSGKQETYAPSAKRNPVNVYGRTKARAEERVQDADPRSVIVRTDQPYGWSEPWQTNTMIEWVLDELDDRGQIGVFEDWFNMPTYVPDLVEVITKVLSRDTSATYHAVGPDYRNRYDWARKIASTFGHDPDMVEPTSSEEVGLPATRPTVRLEVNGTYDELNVDPATVEQGLKRMLER